MKAVNTSAVNEMNEPADEITSHAVMHWGSWNHPGIADRPRKCCGKKVKFTPTNIMVK